MRTSRTGRWGATAVAVTAALALAAPATASIDSGRADFEPGAPGVGDPYYPDYGNGGYDVGNYDLSVRYDKGTADPGTGQLDGTALITARATQDLSSFNLDLVGLTVHSVLVNGRKATWSRTDHELTVTPPKRLAKGEQFTVEVSYDGTPVTFTIAGTTLEAGFIHTEDGATVAGQPEVATAWFPVNDHPQDRARYTYRVTVPDEDEVVANGLPRSEKSRNGWTTHVWKVDDPQISYLATIDIGQWDVDRYRLDDGLPVIDAVDPAIESPLRENAEASLARQPEIHDALEGWFGRYPFQTSGGIVDDYDNLRFALETQGRPVYSKLFFRNGPNPGVVVHELAHQWFGDSVAVHHWADIWLNEGFASYAEWLWAEHEGEMSTQEMFEATYDSIPADDPFWDVTIGDPGIDDLFADPVYTRGALTVQALRNEVGDSAFWDIVRTWTRRHANSTGSTAQFMRLAEQRSGQQLDSFFDTWLFTGEKPPASALSTRSADSGTDAEAQARARDWRASMKDRLATAGRH